jgi:hypothetical protein
MQNWGHASNGFKRRPALPTRLYAAKRTNPCLQLAHGHEVDNSIWRNSRQARCCKTKVHKKQLPRMMGIGPQGNPRALFAGDFKQAYLTCKILPVVVDGKYRTNLRLVGGSCFL